MDKQQSGNRQEKKAQLRVVQAGRGSIGGLVVLGGALAIAGLVGASVFHNTKKGDAKKSHGRSQEDKSRCKGLPSILETPQQTCHRSRCCTSNESANMVSTQMDSTELLSTESLMISEENSVLAIGERNENSVSAHQKVLVDGWTPASVLPQDVFDGSEERPLPEKDGSILAGCDKQMVGVEKCMEKTASVQSIQGAEDDGESDSVLMEVVKEESVDIENKSTKEAIIQSVLGGGGGGGERNNDVDDEIRCEESVIEKVEERSEETESSFAESNAEAIWPADLLQELPRAPEATAEKLQVMEEKIVEKDVTTISNESHQFNDSKCKILNNSGDDYGRIEDSGFFEKGKTHDLQVMNDQIQDKLKTGIWVWSLLGLMLWCYYYLPITTVCLTLLLIVVLSLYGKI